MGRTTRTRKADILADLPDDEAQAVPEVAAKPSPAPKAKPAESPRLQKTDLAEIANMSMDDLAALMDLDSVGRAASVGDQVTGTISRISREGVFVEIGAKSEGQMDADEFDDPQVGDEVTAYVMSSGEWGISLSKRLSGAAADQFLEEAVASEAPVEGKVVGHNKGGFDVRIGSVRAFCPRSQMERLLNPDLDTYVGNTYTFRIIEADEKVVVSRRILLEANIEEKIAEFWSTVAVGDTFDGQVSNVQKFGVFVDLGGVDGLVPTRELSWDPSATAARGQRLEVRVLDIDHEARKLTLSAKDPGASPWTNLVGTEFIEGGTYSGLVVRIEPFGAFVELAPGLHGLMHQSRAGGPLPAEGDRIDVTLLEVDLERNRLALAAVGFKAAADTPAIPDETVTGTVREVLGNGVVIDLDDGRSGWLSVREVDLPAGTVLAQRYRRGRKVTARVKEMDVQRNRLTLTQKASASAGDQAWRKHKKGKGKESFGTFGDLLKGWKG